VQSGRAKKEAAVTSSTHAAPDGAALVFGTLVIIERTSGLVVDRLLGAGHPVVPVHPASFYTARPQRGATGAKSDPGDSYKLADYLRTDGHRLRRLESIEPGLRELQALVRLRDDQVRARTAATNQLAATLDAHWPGPRDLFRSLASPIALEFLADYPTPQAAAHLSEPAWGHSADTQLSAIALSNESPTEPSEAVMPVSTRRRLNA
jgi:transposase